MEILYFMCMTRLNSENFQKLWTITYSEMKLAEFNFKDLALVQQHLSFPYCHSLRVSLRLDFYKSVSLVFQLNRN